MSVPVLQRSSSGCGGNRTTPTRRPTPTTAPLARRRRRGTDGGTTSDAPQPRPIEPILFPKFRIRLADFPYSLSSGRPEAANLGDLMRKLVRDAPGHFDDWDFQGTTPALRTRPTPSCSPPPRPPSPRDALRGSRRVTQKRWASPVRMPSSPNHVRRRVRSVRVRANLRAFPLRRRSGLRGDPNRASSPFGYDLGSANPRTCRVLEETFPSPALKVPT